MRLIVLIAFLFASCGIPSSSNPDVSSIQDTLNSASETQSSGESMMTPALKNEELWKKILTRPDSVPLPFSVNNQTEVLFLLSGQLDSSSMYYRPKAIKVSFPDGRNQELVVQGSAMMWEVGQRRPYLEFADINFDGNFDLHVFDNAGASGNFWNSVWLYNGNDGFVYSKDISEISAPRIDDNARQILSYNRSGSCEETVVFYKVHGNDLMPVKSVFNQLENCDTPSGCICVTYERRLVGKKWEVFKLDAGDGELYYSTYQK